MPAAAAAITRTNSACLFDTNSNVVAPAKGANKIISKVESIIECYSREMSLVAWTAPADPWSNR